MNKIKDFTSENKKLDTKLTDLEVIKKNISIKNFYRFSTKNIVSFKQ